MLLLPVFVNGVRPLKIKGLARNDFRSGPLAGCIFGRMNTSNQQQGLNNPWVTVASFPSPIEAQIAKTRLESEGIECFVRDETTLGMNPYYSVAMGGSRLDVRENELAAARALLGVAHKEPEASRNSCPRCGAIGKPTANLARKGSAILSWLFATVPVPFLREEKACPSCGNRWRR
jgi:Putative prokaryotic signal transducing protein